MRNFIGIVSRLLVAFLVSSIATAQEPNLPKVVLLGDSIRLGYTSVVVKQLAGKAVVVSPTANGGDSSNVLKHLEEWAIRKQPAVVHFNCGIHDTKKSKTSGTYQVPPDKYEANLRAIVEQLRKETKAAVMFALTTPIIDSRAATARTKVDYDLLDASGRQYNEIALRVMEELNVPVNDLRAALGDVEDQARFLGTDGIHFTAAGTEKLGTAVSAFIAERLPAAKGN